MIEKNLPFPGSAVRQCASPDQDEERRFQPSPPRFPLPPPGYIGQNFANPHCIMPDLRDRGGTPDQLTPKDDDDEDDDEPIIESCCFCCNLGFGILFGALFFLIFDVVFLVRKTKNMFYTELVDTVFEIEENKITTAMEIISTIFSAFAVLASFILLVSVCVCGSPDKKKTMGIVSRYWAFQIGLNALFQAVESLFNTMPRDDSEFFVSLPGIGVDEVVGGVAIAVTWIFTVGYIFAYFFMIVILISYSAVLKRMAKKKMESLYAKRRIRQVESDLQSQITVSDRISDMSAYESSVSPTIGEGNYQDVMSMNGKENLEEIYQQRRLPVRRPTGYLPRNRSVSPDPILQAQLAMLHPMQKFQFLQQQITARQQMMLPNRPLPKISEDQSDQISELSVKSKPNSSGHNVRFSNINKEATIIEDSTQVAPSFGPRPANYVPEFTLPNQMNMEANNYSRPMRAFPAPRRNLSFSLQQNNQNGTL
ncbi:Oidioi.mRNA.OKI2018_I69.PAR.g9669.t1.cds [Oikopleura dioica]|uniref:Oidioi.mRNA.OKI2018_I69.PAR.g9669.t1.cds n=1 Tax=Oikopleura dioica TaxID=34765 RepID=A0ABN7RPI2_OIKDI|nr:Oidioi.mRNA.OKI2018_I69.PAR.g9669.t1.cds [Oikopleura dioica]